MATVTQFIRWHRDYLSAGSYVETDYNNTAYTGTLQLQDVMQTLPVVDNAHNGSNVAATSRVFYDPNGNIVWQEDQLGKFAC